MARTKSKSSSSVSLKNEKNSKKQSRSTSKKSPSINIKTSNTNTKSPKTVQKGRMSINTEEMLKDFVELGRIKESSDVVKAGNGQKGKFSFDIKDSPLINFIQTRNASYFKVALIFLTLVSVFFLSIIYVMNSKAVINVSLKKINNISQIQRSFNVYSETELKNPNNNVVVVSMPIEVNIDDSYAVSGEMVQTDIVEGKIKIINNSNSPRSLVSTTRFVSDETSNLYRLRKTVTVPANSYVEAEVYADNKDIKGDRSGVRFTIPGLRDPKIQEVFYGESISNLNFTSTAKTIVSQKDLDSATLALETKLRQKAMNTLKDNISKYSGFDMIPDSFDFGIISKDVDAKLNEEVSSIKITGKAKATALFVNKEKVLNIIKSNVLNQNNSSSVVRVKDESLFYALSKMDLVNKVAVLNIAIDNYSYYNVDQILDREIIAGMDVNDFYLYVQEKDFANRVQVVSYPFWNSKLPKISENIIIRVK